MNNIKVVARHELRNILKQWTTLFVLGLFVVMGVIFVYELPPSLPLEIFLPFLSLAPIIFFPIVAVSQLFVLEKKNGSIEALFSTPLTVKDIWIGKVISSTFVAYIISLLMSLTVVITAHLRGLPIPLSPVSLAIILLINPMIGGTIIGIFGIIQLITSHETIGHFVLFVIFFGYVYGFTPLTRLLSNSSIPPQYIFLFVDVIIVVALSIATLLLSKLLTEERVVMNE